MNSFYSIILTLFFVIDALGLIPDYLHLVSNFDAKKRRKILLRELLIALIIMIVFYFVGQWLFTLLSLSKPTTEIAGGIVTFLIAIRLIFPREKDAEKITMTWGEGEHFVVPLATPLIAGPSVLAVIMIYAQEFKDYRVLGAIVIAWFLSSIIFFLAAPIFKLTGEKGLLAAQRLMGLIVSLLAIQMFLIGIKHILVS